MSNLQFYAETILNKFKRDIEQGYVTKDKTYVIEMLSKGLEKSAISTELDKAITDELKDKPKDIMG